jgi:hypothetical protein
MRSHDRFARGRRTAALAELTAAGKSGEVVLSPDGTPITAPTRTANLGTSAVDGVQIGDTTKHSYTISWDDVSMLAG